MARAHPARPRQLAEPCARPRSCGASGAQAHVIRLPGKANGVAFGGLRLAVVLADHDRWTGFGLALEQPMIALEDAGDDLRVEPRVPEADALGTDADGHRTAKPGRCRSTPGARN